MSYVSLRNSARTINGRTSGSNPVEARHTTIDVIYTIIVHALLAMLITTLSYFTSQYICYNQNIDCIHCIVTASILQMG